MANEDKVLCRAPSNTDLEPHTVQHLTELINSVYDVAESGMWKKKGTRTTTTEVQKLLKAKALILAEIDGKFVGLVTINRFDSHTGEFGMLVADPNHRGLGVGSALIEAAEKWGNDNGFKIMRLELLTPREWKHPSKEFLKQWYGRLGYTPQKTEAFEILHPEKINELATKCDFTVWHKKI